MLLATLNSHARDSYIVFNEAAHSYTVGDTQFISVTTFLKKFFNEFDADKILEKMARYGALAKKYPNMSADEVKASWKLNGQEAAKTGTQLHKYIEMWFNGAEITFDEKIDLEVAMFQDWVVEFTRLGCRKYIPFRTEWVIYDEELGIAGTIDMLFRTDEYNPRRVAIFDWKCSKEIKYKNKYERARDPVAHLEDCNYSHYSLQLNLYKFLLEKNYDLQVDEMNLIVIHRNNPEGAQIIPVYPMPTEIAAILSHRK